MHRGRVDMNPRVVRDNFNNFFVPWARNVADAVRGLLWYLHNSEDFFATAMGVPARILPATAGETELKDPELA
jgi:hypothetical protein